MFSIINGVRTRYDLHGPADKAALVLIHGFPLTSAQWKPQIKALSADFRLCTYDLRGMGRSDLGPPPQPLETYVDDLFSLLGHLGLKTAALCGLSMGGYIALRAAQREPGRFWALALCDTKADADNDQAKIARAAGIQSIRALGPESHIQGMLTKLASPQSSGPRDPKTRSLLAMMRENNANGMANALSAMAGRSDTHAALRLYGGPLLALAGERDPLIPPALSQAMAAEARQGRFMTVPKAGHLSNLDAPDFFNQALLDFLHKAKAPA